MFQYIDQFREFRVEKMVAVFETMNGRCWEVCLELCKFAVWYDEVIFAVEQMNFIGAFLQSGRRVDCETAIAADVVIVSAGK